MELVLIEGNEWLVFPGAIILLKIHDPTSLQLILSIVCLLNAMKTAIVIALVYSIIKWI